jgi:lipopolysaccharide export system protein LptA
MATSSRKRFAALALAIAGGVAFAATARGPREQPIDLKADHYEIDFRNNTMLFRKITISQGGMSVSADQAQVTGTKLDFDNSRWVFRGNVKITMEQGSLTADHAEVTFANKLLAAAVAEGKPAEFEQRAAKSGKLAKGHAELIEYDVTKGTVKLSRNAYLSDGPNEIHGEALKYNILEQKVIADAPEQNSQRVHITIMPPAQVPPPSAAPKP